MIVSEKYRYLFLQTPRTASTAIASELRELYNGKEIHFKHANYYTFLREASSDEKTYFVFAGVRDPIASVYGKFHKYLSDHQGRYSRIADIERRKTLTESRDLAIYRSVQETRSFPSFVRSWYQTPFVNHLAIHSDHCAEIIRFEDLQSDFARTLEKLSITPQRNLPPINVTKRSTSAGPLEGLTIKDKRHFTFVFGPFIEEWGYKLPDELAGIPTPMSAKFTYALKKKTVRLTARLAATAGFRYPL